MALSKLKYLLFVTVLFGTVKCAPKPYSFNPYYDYCNIIAGGDEVVVPQIPSWVNQGLEKLGKKKSEFEVVYNYSFINGESIWDTYVAFVDEGNLELNYLTFNYLEDRESEIIISVEQKEVSRKKQDFIYSTLRELSDWQWSVELICIEDCYESDGLFYVKRNDKILYYFKLENGEFTKMPSLGLSKRIIKMINIFEK